jgi:hypothetical protein
MKLMYLAKRKPTFPSQEASRARWRQHGALAMSLPSWTRERRYVHADALPASGAIPAHEYDGVGVMWFAPGEAAFSPNPTPEAIETTKMLQADELQTFDGIVRPRMVLTSEAVVKAGGLTDVTGYLFFRDADAAERAAGTFAKLTSPKAPERVVMNRVERMASPTPLIDYKGIVEVAARNRADLDAMLGAAGVKADLVVAAHEVLLWDHGPVAR